MKYPYVLVTAAKDEERFIAETIASVVRQTQRPSLWIIVDDGSIDRTVQIVKSFAISHSFIHLHRVKHNEKRGFDSKDRAINLGYELARQTNFDFVGIQDADIAPANNWYYAAVLDEFDADPTLGIAGGYVYESHGRAWASRPGNSPDSVAGGIQMFRRRCYEEIGGYTPLQLGGEDWLAQLDARMRGWSVRALPSLAVYHYRTTSSAEGRIKGLFRSGMMDASFGSHTMFELLKCFRRLPEQPILVSSIVRFCGFLWWKASQRRPVISRQHVEFLRSEQRKKISGLFLVNIFRY